MRYIVGSHSCYLSVRFLVGLDLDLRIDLFSFGKSKHAPTILRHVDSDQRNCIGDVTPLRPRWLGLSAIGGVSPMDAIIGCNRHCPCGRDRYRAVIY